MQTDKLTDINQKWLQTMPIKQKEVLDFRNKINLSGNENLAYMDDLKSKSM